MTCYDLCFHSIDLWSHFCYHNGRRWRYLCIPITQRTHYGAHLTCRVTREFDLILSRMWLEIMQTKIHNTHTNFQKLDCRLMLRPALSSRSEQQRRSTVAATVGGKRLNKYSNLILQITFVLFSCIAWLLASMNAFLGACDFLLLISDFN
jgi:hypothetical protein